MDFSVAIYNKKIRQDFLVESGYQRKQRQTLNVSLKWKMSDCGPHGIILKMEHTA